MANDQPPVGDNKARANKLNLVGRLDYHREMSAQLQWQEDPDDRPVRVVYSSSGEPTAAVLADDDAIVDYTLFWVACRNAQEANYLMAVINSNTLYEAVSALMPKGCSALGIFRSTYGGCPFRSLIPKNAMHREVAMAGKAAATAAARRLANLRKARGNVSVTVVRRELRAWLKLSKQGKAVEDAVGKLLAGG